VTRPPSRRRRRETVGAIAVPGTSAPAQRPEEPVTSNKGHRLTQLDGLRGIAVVAVILFHTSNFPGGFLGVDLFFVLSGYVITGGLLREVSRHGGVRLLPFWGRRARRLMPAFLATLALVLVVTTIVGSASVRLFALDDTPWALAQVVNWHFIADKIGYGHATDVHVFAHLWSISLEWQFYLAWPIVVALVAVRRNGERLLAIVAGVLAVVSALLMMHWGVLDATRAYEGTDTRAFALLLGAVAAARPIPRLVAGLDRRSASVAAIVLITGLGFLWANAAGTDAPWLYRGGLLVHALLAAALIAVLAAWPRTLVSSILGSLVPRRLGEWSYSIYLVHWPIIVLLPELGSGQPPWLRTTAVLALSISVGALSTVLVENPIRAGLPWTRGRVGTIVLLAALLAVVLLWLALPRPELGAGTVDVNLL
jgi:peptidoglycan/LPS O-acetylase OafA/YrhL